jgi:hypothetical protein
MRGAPSGARRGERRRLYQWPAPLQKFNRGKEEEKSENAQEECTDAGANPDANRH